MQVDLVLEHDLYATDLGKEESDGLYVATLLPLLPAGVEEVDEEQEEVDEEIAESRQEALQFLMSAALDPMLVEDVHEFIPAVECIHKHPNAGQQGSILHGEALGDLLFPLAAVVEVGVDSGDGVATMEVVELIVCIEDIIVEVLGVQFRVELRGDVMGQVLELLDQDGDEVLGLMEEGLDG